ncbi:hypothetical protein GW17_00011577 [Ensete ventricosum]|nr:hypothetical protein GW17_00011577 [Ensete ventricosum]
MSFTVSQPTATFTRIGVEYCHRQFRYLPLTCTDTYKLHSQVRIAFRSRRSISNLALPYRRQANKRKRAQRVDRKKSNQCVCSYKTADPDPST